MPNFKDMTQYELISLLKDAANELGNREIQYHYVWLDGGVSKAVDIVNAIEAYDGLNENRHPSR